MTKRFYALLVKNGESKCYKFKSKSERDFAVTIGDFIPITAAEAMKMFGYTDDASRRVIRAEVWR